MTSRTASDIRLRGTRLGATNGKLEAIATAQDWAVLPSRSVASEILAEKATYRLRSRPLKHQTLVSCSPRRCAALYSVPRYSSVGTRRCIVDFTLAITGREGHLGTGRETARREGEADDLHLPAEIGRQGSKPNNQPLQDCRTAHCTALRPQDYRCGLSVHRPKDQARGARSLWGDLL